jgi:hypothetical protein
MTDVRPADRGRADRVYPTRILRLGTMVNSLLVELRDVSLESEAAELVSDIYRRSVAVLGESLPGDLRAELDALLPQLADVPSQTELRLAYAQLHCWLAGLLHGLQLASASRELEARRRRAEAPDSTDRRLRERVQQARDASYL